MRIRTFEDLLVWEKGHALVLEIYRMTKYFPSDERFGLTSQIRRSSISVCANIVEGYKNSTKDFLRFLNIAQGSLEETKYHLLLSKDLHYLSEENCTSLYEHSNEVGMMLNGLIKNIRT